MSMQSLGFGVVALFSLLVGCSDDEKTDGPAEGAALEPSWWEQVQPVTLGDEAFYGKPCSVTRVRDDLGIRSEELIFKVPSRLLTYCAKAQPDKNYLEYDGEYIILHVDRQTAGAGSWTGERFRSADFESWEEYIGVTWVKGEEHEAWRAVGSTSSVADSRKKVVRE